MIRTIVEPATLPKIDTRPPPLSDYVDVEMPDAPRILPDNDSADESGDDSPEMKTLKRGNRGRPEATTDQSRLGVPTENVEIAESIMKSEFTVNLISFCARSEIC